MGGQPSKEKRGKNIFKQNWDVVSNLQHYNIVRNKEDGRVAEQHYYVLESKHDPSKEDTIYERRTKTSIPLVRVHDYQWEAKGSTFLPKNYFRVITERLTHRLSECPQLTFDESLYVLEQALEGYSFLYDSIGPFDVNSNMIGITQQGEVKVWLNQNLGRNYPFHQKRTLQSTRIDDSNNYNGAFVPLHEIEMVRNIVNVVEDRCEEGIFPEDFREKIRQNIGFRQAKQVIADECKKQSRVKINRIDLFNNIVKSKVSKPVQKNLAQTGIIYRSDVYIQPTVSIIQPNPHYVKEVHPVNYQASYIPTRDSGKNVFSFNQYKREIQA